MLEADDSMVVWWATRVECVSALVRRIGEPTLTPTGERQARSALAALSRAWAEIQPLEAVRISAERLLGLHSLRAADALQLAAALEWCDARPGGMAIVSFDDRLRAAADREGFVVLPE